MYTELLVEMSGVLGVLCYVGSYALLQLGVIRGSNYSYAFLNLGGAVFVAISLLNNWNTWSALVSLSFTVFSVVGIIRVYRASRGLRFNQEEADFNAARLSTMPSRDVRRFLSRGVWINGAKGQKLTTQGEPVTHLRYLASGSVDIIVGGQRIAEVGKGEFIGELACMKKGPASATVVLNQDTRFFQISSEALNALVRGKPDFRAHLEFAFAGNIQSKLVATNALLEQALKAGHTNAS